MEGLNFDTLAQEIKAAARRAFASVRRNHPDETLCAYALYSDEGAMTVCPSVNSSSHLSQMQASSPTDAEYYKWSPAEWAFEFEGAEYFDRVSSAVASAGEGICEPGEFSKFGLEVYDARVKALEGLVEEGFFVSAGQGNPVVLFAVSDFCDADLEVSWARRLNPEDVAGAFEGWLRAAAG